MMMVTSSLLKLTTRSDVFVPCGPDQGTTFNISRRELTGSKCAVCSGGGLRKSCSSSVVLRGLEATPVEISCLALRSSSPSESVQTKVSCLCCSPYASQLLSLTWYLCIVHSAWSLTCVYLAMWLVNTDRSLSPSTETVLELCASNP